MDGMRALLHIYALLFHYNSMRVNAATNIPGVFVLHLVRLSIVSTFTVFFVINGINSGQWFTKHVKSRRSLTRVSLKFVFERLSMIVPMTLLCYSANVFYFLAMGENRLLRRAKDSLMSNLLFVANFVSFDNNVMKFIINRDRR